MKEIIRLKLVVSNGIVLLTNYVEQLAEYSTAIKELRFVEGVISIEKVKGIIGAFNVACFKNGEELDAVMVELSNDCIYFDVDKVKVREELQKYFIEVTEEFIDDHHVTLNHFISTDEFMIHESQVPGMVNRIIEEQISLPPWFVVDLVKTSKNITKEIFRTDINIDSDIFWIFKDNIYTKNYLESMKK